MTSLESSLKYNILSSAHKEVGRFLIILLVTNQSRINFNAARQSPTG